ncbi:MAG: histidine kinase dimerization/phosphoacceptor domain -containing protein [Prochloraceae cyanobacterium]|nr:histidine kinase dimerization/phosphoacceptor domain -containing protein [Prochloraceae cyanobacterium]
MLEIISNLFAPRDYIPHGHCYLWQPSLVWLHLLSDLLIALAYFAISITLIYFIRQREDIPFKQIFILFSAFIISCGTTHFMGVWTLWHPDYWFAGAIKAITAVISCYTALELIPIIPQAISLPSPEALQNEIRERQRVEQEIKQAKNFLQTIIDYLPITIFVKDATPERFGQLLLINKTGERLFGLNAEEMIGKTSYDLFRREQAQFDESKDRNTFVTGIMEDIPEEPIDSHTLGKRILHTFKVPLYDKEQQPQYLLCISEDITERKQAEIQIEESLREKEILLQEIHHRVKNNLFVVSSLLELQSDRLADSKVVRAFEDSQNRIYSMALIHEQLYRSIDLAHVDFSKYLKALVSHLSESYNLDSKLITCEFNLEPIALNIESAHPCGLIVNELVTNAFKHAFIDRQEGRIYLNLHKNDRDRIVLIIQDNGRGLPSGIDFQNTESLGMQLVCTLTKQLEGTIKMENSHGTSFELVFSELNYKNRL